MGERKRVGHGFGGGLGRRTRRAALIGATATTAAVSAALIGSTGAPANSNDAGASGAAGCTYTTHVMAILDDSGSTAGTDPNELRDAFMDLIVAAYLLAGPPPVDLAAVEFGATAKTIFTPLTINSANEGTIRQQIDAATNSDENTTNYNAAFAQADLADPSVNKALNSDYGRIFLTDGEHNVGVYANGHLPGPEMKVIGLNISSAAGQAQLDKIANDTQGEHISLDDASELIPAAIRVFANFACLDLKERSTGLPAPGKSKTIVAEKLGNAKEASVTLSLSPALIGAGIGDLSFQIGEKKEASHKVTSTARKATSAAKERGKPKLKVSCEGSENFLTMQLTAKKALGKKLKVKVKAPNAEDVVLPADNSGHRPDHDGLEADRLKRGAVQEAGRAS